MKAELFSSDFVVGLSIFIIAIGVFGVYYINIQNDVEEYSIRNELQTKSNTVADLLISTSGQPKGWSADNVDVIGLNDEGIINLTKFEEMQKMDYYTVKKFLGIGGYEYYINLENETGQTLVNDSTIYEYGMNKDADALQVFYVERFGLSELEGNISKTILGVVIWL